MNKIVELKSTKSTMGGRIRKARTGVYLTQKELARESDISVINISKFERNFKCPNSSELLSLSRALGVKAEYFFRPITIEEE